VRSNHTATYIGLRPTVSCGWVAAIVGLGALACAPSSPPSDLDSPSRFDWAQEKFDNGKYGSAINGFQEFIIRDPLSPLTDSAQLMLAESYLGNHQRLEAAAEFDRLATTRPNSSLADDAQFGACRAYWELSPKIPLDQEFTREAVDACGQLLEFFPQSEHRQAAEELTIAARSKLAEKEYDIGQSYFRRRLYESANIQYKRALEMVEPRTPIVAEILAAQYESYRLIGFDREADETLRRLMTDFPESDEARKLAAEAEDGA